VRRTSMTILYGVSIVLHASLGAGFAEIEPEKEPERIAIAVVQPPKKKEQAKDEPPPPPAPPPIAPKPKAARPKAVEAPPPPTAAPPPSAASADVPTFGIAMSGGVGLGGVAVPLGESLHAAREPVKRVAQAKTLVEAKKEVVEVECAEPPVKPKPREMQKPEYTEEARAAGIEGKVRVELTVGADGSVRSAKVLESLGHGLDEAALNAVRAATFEPGLQCGKPVEATFVVAIRFSL
jgi:protein TonB